MARSTPQSRQVSNVSEFVSLILALNTNKDTAIFYRGNSKFEYSNTPHVFRKEYFKQNEHSMITDLIAYHPEEFRDDQTALEQLVRAQHYGLPTRLLDVTRNPLISLYFAAQDPTDKKVGDGAVVVFETSKERVKTFESDTVSCIANLCFLKKSEKDEIYNFIKFNIKRKRVAEPEISEFNALHAVRRLRHFILSEKTHFEPQINPNSLRQFIAVIPKQSNRRIIAQTGAFLAFGALQKLSSRSSKKVKYRKIRIPHEHKARIRDELNDLHINRRSLFPEIQEASKHIISEYQKIRPEPEDDFDEIL